MLRTSFDMEVPFYDVDAYRIVWHGNYPKYFEVARCQLLEAIGYPYEKMEQSGYFFPVIDLHTRYVKPIVFKQKIQVSAMLRDWENKLVIDYVIIDLDTGQRLTKGRTQQVAVLMPDNITQFQSPPELIQHIEAALRNTTEQG
ncbi:thioesterase [Arenicella chitinivorans]|uniref:Thioesterase n=1 Tax=Arenicella chitinivorans TaxID=1329800 RepID=A0A918VQ25_9GAMM|nr:acyl-CoA thioesterase [Arenicella chitinivorans]GHA14666.1 thioesterase [Arenicella chitinivorans]